MKWTIIEPIANMKGKSCTNEVLISVNSFITCGIGRKWWTNFVLGDLFKTTQLQFHPVITDVKGLMNSILYRQIFIIANNEIK